jgi:glycopeptide antibiotics resistance protein
MLYRGEKMNVYKKNRALTISVLVFYVIILLWITLLKCNQRTPIYELKIFLGSMTVTERFVYATSHFTLKDGTISEMILNVFIFIPFGVFIPLLKGRTAPIFTTAIALLSTLLIECLQLLLCFGWFTYSDLILNTAGAVLGIIIYFYFVKRIKEEHINTALKILNGFGAAISVFAIINTVLNIEIYM